MRKISAMILALAVLPLAAFAADTTTLVYGTTNKVTDMDPANAYDLHTWEIFQNISEGLVTYKPGTQEVVPGLAQKFTVNKANDEYTFVLRPGLKFSNGDVLDANAVKWTIDRVEALKGDPYGLVDQYVKSVTVVDPLTVVFKLKQPVGYFTGLLATPTYFPMDPKVFPADKIVKDPSELNGGVLVSSGPYLLSSFKRDEEVVLDANPSYYGPKPKIKRIIIRYYADATTLRLALSTGEIDLAFQSLNPSDIVDLKKKTDYKTFRLPGSQIRYLTFETSESVFKSKTLRQAIASLVNRPEILQKAYLGLNSPLYSMIPSSLPYQVNSFKKTYGDGNLKKAEVLLKKAGYSQAKPFAFDLWYTPSHYGDTEVNMAEVLKAELEKTPLIKVTLKSAEWATYKDNYHKKLMPAFLLGWYPDYTDSDDYTSPFGQSDSSPGMGVYFSNKEWDVEFLKEQSSSNPRVRAAAFQKIQNQWADEVPTVPIWQGDLYVFTKTNVAGVMVTPSMLLLYSQLVFTK